MLPDCAFSQSVFLAKPVLSNPGREYAIYFDGDGPADIAFDLPSGEYSGEWIDTKTGKSTPLETFRLDSKKEILRSPAFQNGIALRLKKSYTVRGAVRRRGESNR